MQLCRTHRPLLSGSSIVFKRSTNNTGHKRFVTGVIANYGINQFTIPENGRTVGNFTNLIDVVANKDHTGAASHTLTHQLKQLFDT